MKKTIIAISILVASSVHAGSASNVSVDMIGVQTGGEPFEFAYGKFGLPSGTCKYGNRIGYSPFVMDLTTDPVTFTDELDSTMPLAFKVAYDAAKENAPLLYIAWHKINSPGDDVYHDTCWALNTRP